MPVDQSAVSRVVGVDVDFKIFESGRVTFLPQRVSLIGQGNEAATYPLTKQAITGGAAQVASIYGFGSPLHLAAKELFPVNGDGIGGIPVTVYPLDADGSGVVGTGDITAAGTQTAQEEYIVKINKNPSSSVVLPVGTTASAAITLFKTAIDANLDMPIDTGANTGVELVLATTSKWKGESAKDIFIEIEGVEAGIAFTITQLAGAAVNPDVDDALNLIGVNVWETMIVNCLNYDDSTTLTKVATFGEGRWGELVKSPLVAFYGTADDLATRTVITDARKTDRTNALVPVPGSNELPFVIAARAVARIAKTANNNPPQNYKGRLTGLVPGADTDQETYLQRDTSIKAGSGSTILVDGEIELNDVVTMYHPDGETPPAYRYVVDIVKLQNIIFNVRLINEADEWKGAPLLPDSTPTVNSTAKKPKDLRTAYGNLADNLGLEAIISDPDFTKSNLTADISGSNPKRLDSVFPVKLSGNVEINSSEIFFGFFFG